MRGPHYRTLAGLGLQALLAALAACAALAVGAALLAPHATKAQPAHRSGAPDRPQPQHLPRDPAASVGPAHPAVPTLHAVPLGRRVSVEQQCGGCHAIAGDAAQPPAPAPRLWVRAGGDSIEGRTPGAG